MNNEQGEIRKEENEELGREERPLSATIEPKTAPPPTAQTSLRWRQDANTERMRNPLAG
jgi:hypothetical protein